MYYQDYDDYMRNALGYNASNENMNMPTYPMVDDYSDYTDDRLNAINNVSEEHEKMYPDIYKIVYPMVRKACDEETRPMSEEVANELTETVYKNLEVNMQAEMNVKMELRNGDVRNPNAKSEKRDLRSPNNIMKDLVKILVLRELLGKRSRPLSRPRPPFPGPGPMPRPPMPGMRSPMPGLQPPQYRNYDMFY